MKKQSLLPGGVFWILALSANKSRGKKKEGDPTNQRAQREEHKKDEAIEEFIEPDPYTKPTKGKEDPETEKGMGRTEKAKKQPSDERDRSEDKS